MKFDDFIKGLIGEPRPDNPNSKSPCSKCVGKRAGCTYMEERNPDVECSSFAEIGKNKILFEDGSTAEF